jgi:Rrf2 family protein
MLTRAGTIALRALVELARCPTASLSVNELARRQGLPQPMLEQVVLRLRRAGLVQARRGRHGGYRLAAQADAMPLNQVLLAVGGLRRGAVGPAPPAAAGLEASAGVQVEQQLLRRLDRLVLLELQRLTLAELLYDQRSWEASLEPEGGLMLG